MLAQLTRWIYKQIKKRRARTAVLAALSPDRAKNQKLLETWRENLGKELNHDNTHNRATAPWKITAISEDPPENTPEKLPLVQTNRENTRGMVEPQNKRKFGGILASVHKILVGSNGNSAERRHRCVLGRNCKAYGRAGLGKTAAGIEEFLAGT